MRKRLLGITLLALLQFVLAFFFFLDGLLRLSSGEAFAPDNDPVTAELAAQLTRRYGPATVFAFFSGLPAVIYLLLGWSLWTLKSWARTVFLAILYLGVVITLLMLLWVSVDLVHIVNLACSALLIGYLSRPAVRSAFSVTVPEPGSPTAGTGFS